MNYMAVPGLHRPTVFDTLIPGTIATGGEVMTERERAKAIIAIVEKYFGVEPGATVKGKEKRKSTTTISKVRFMCYYFIDRNTSLKLVQIAGLFNLSHHTSIMYGLNMVKQQISAPVYNSDWMDAINDLKNLIENR